ncbi:transcriptional corepressor LEUNIG [Trifolium repens]|nr:transcriptional corepressor LEUNIG [Trifolium repens]
MDSNNNHSPWKNEAMFHRYVHEYMIKRGMHDSAEIFMNEANVPETLPIDMQIVNSMFDDSSEGVLHEWWSVFYEIFLSKLRSRQEFEPQSPNMAVPRMIDTSTNISSFRIPQMSMNEQRPQQFQASSSFNNMMAQTASRSMPPRQHNNNTLGNLAEHIDPSLVAHINENDLNFFLG